MSLLPSLAALEAEHARKVAEERALALRIAEEKSANKEGEDRWLRHVEEALSDPKKRALLDRNATLAGQGLSAIERGSPEWDARWYIMRLDWAVGLATLGLPFERSWWKPKRPAPDAICGIGSTKRFCRHSYAAHGSVLGGACSVDGCGCGRFRW